MFVSRGFAEGKAAEMICRLVALAALLACWSSRRVDGANTSLNFMMIGDWGGKPYSPYYTQAEKDISVQMGQKATEVGSKFTVALGDNFYTFGVKNVDDPRFKETFENVFTADSLQSRWYVIAGNHDHYGNASAEVAYTEQSTRWYMPNFYYTETVKIEGTNTQVQFVYIDTVILAGLTHPTIKWLPPDGPASLNAAEDEWAWINDTLSSSTADWLFVLGHYPVWSIAEHGPTQLLVDRLRPMLIKYKVDAYFCGHDHDAQHIHEQNNTVEYFVNGAAHETNPSTAHLNDIPPDSLLYRYGVTDNSQSHGAFTWMSVSPTMMNLTYYDDTGKELYFYSRKQMRK